MLEIDHSGFKRLILLRYYYCYGIIEVLLVRCFTVRVHAEPIDELVDTQSTLLRDSCRFFSTGPMTRYWFTTFCCICQSVFAPDFLVFMLSDD